ncbi:MAG: hypothetical protein R3D87_14900 [Paracoccaceae bacterium]
MPDRIFASSNTAGANTKPPGDAPHRTERNDDEDQPAQIRDRCHCRLLSLAAASATPVHASGKNEKNFLRAGAALLIGSIYMNNKNRTQTQQAYRTPSYQAPTYQQPTYYQPTQPAPSFIRPRPRARSTAIPRPNGARSSPS